MRNVVMINVCLLAAAVALTGCKSGGGSGGVSRDTSRAVSSLAETTRTVESAQRQIDTVVQSMNALTEGRNVQDSLRQFSRQIVRTQEDAETAKRRADAMRERTKAFIEAWEKEMSEVSDPELRARAQERRAAVQQNFDNVRAAARQAGDAYEPFMATLKDIERSVSLDPTPKGVEVVRPSIQRANEQGATLQAALTKMRAELQKISAGLSPTGAAPR